MSSQTLKGLSVVIPAFNEAKAIAETLQAVKTTLAKLSIVSEIIVVDDGSQDETGDIAHAAGVRLIRHPINFGYGRSLLSGIAAASHSTILITDADGTYPIDSIPELLAMYAKGFDMVVGARSGRYYITSTRKRILRTIFRLLAEFTCGRSIPDINSGFRIFRREPVLAWQESISTGFSFTTTTTLLFMLNRMFVGYLPIQYSQRIGESKVHLVKDSLRSLQIIITTIAQFNPLKLFLLLAAITSIGDLTLLGLMAGFYSRMGWIFSIPLAIAWNMLCLIIACGILALSLSKPVVSPESLRSTE